MSGPTNDLWCAAIPLSGLVWLSLKKNLELCLVSGGVWWLSDDIEFSEKRWAAAAAAGARWAWLKDLGYQWTHEYQDLHFRTYLSQNEWL